MGKIKQRNYKIIKRADREYRQKEYELHKERVVKNREKLKAKCWYRKHPKYQLKRKQTEHEKRLSGERVYFEDKLYRIEKDYTRIKGVGIKYNGMIKYVRKKDLKPYKELKKSLTY